jgi:AbrB family looped-hinge helix DNA binding protein
MLNFYMQYRLKISPQGQVTLPKALLKLLDLRPGEFLPIIEKQDSGELILSNNRRKIYELAGKLGRDFPNGVKFETTEALEKAMEEGREAYYKEKYQNL